LGLDYYIGYSVLAIKKVIMKAIRKNEPSIYMRNIRNSVGIIYELVFIGLHFSIQLEQTFLSNYKY